MSLIKDLVSGERLINEQFIIGSVNKSSASNGQLYARINLKDYTGSITGVKWALTKDEENILKVGSVIAVDGYVESYKNSLQLRIEMLNGVSENDYDESKLLKPSPIGKDVLLARLDKIIQQIVDADYKKLVEYIYSEKKNEIIASPAAISVHHEFAPLGLLYHVVSMGESASFLADHYNPINKDLLLAGVLLHDIGKTIELKKENLAYAYSFQGRLLGHISLMSAYIDGVCEKLEIDKEKSTLIKHLILTHHGELEYGSPVLPQTKEAILLHMIDDIDAKMMICDKALAETAPGEFSQKIMPLDNRCLYKSKN